MSELSVVLGLSYLQLEVSLISARHHFEIINKQQEGYLSVHWPG